MRTKPENPRVRVQHLRATRCFGQAVPAHDGLAAPRIRSREERVIILEELDFSWTRSDIARAVELWNAGAGLVEIAEQLRGSGGRAQYETLLLLVHLAREGKISERPGGILGN
ncbi:hypothetical protein [Desulfoscipio geothermicus]|uniref:Helix-turn-helix domain containing protein n=1 Tax=Desulfoscipio geothermicus DSM 3669 TaxID=1121426 RepID=A0A1I6EC69_9FIRM|nr:hypothetical protein [Desulfoscipio geothermicus]SFR15340.1 hypothetical protein SAMN05660706_13528 [Desulfoscipio geothermicus DSM 3669]